VILFKAVKVEMLCLTLSLVTDLAPQVPLTSLVSEGVSPHYTTERSAINPQSLRSCEDDPLSSLAQTNITEDQHTPPGRDRNSDHIGHEPLPDVLEQGRCKGTASGAIPTPKRRALLVGISYKHRPSEEWAPLEGPYEDVTHFRELLIGAYSFLFCKRRLTLILTLDTYGYSPEDITVLRDDPELPDLSQPTRDNMVIELHTLFYPRLALTHNYSFVN
jgi:hypothetical protein